MEENVVPAKEQFKTDVINYIEALGFKRESSDIDIYNKSIITQGRTMIININGQTMQQQGQGINVLLSCDIYGFGSIDDIEFLEVCFIVKQNDEIQVNQIECFYLNELELFKKAFHSIFKI